jgi:hypothetical protein
MIRMREIGLMLLTAAIIFFAGQNLNPVPVEFLFWEFQVPLALITLVPLLAGLLIGAFATVIKMSKRRRTDEPEDELEEETVSPEEGEVEEGPTDDDPFPEV